MNALLAQANRRGGQGDPDAQMAVLAVQLAVVGIALAVGLTILIFFLLTMSKALKRVHPRNRRMEPGEVWLALIPCFNLYWNFQIAQRIDASLKAEFRDRGMGRRDDCGGKAGHNWALMAVLSRIPCVQYVTIIIEIVYFIIFWVQIAGYSRELAEGPRGYDDRDDDDDGYGRRDNRRGYGDRDDDYDDRDDDGRGRRDDPPPSPPPPQTPQTPPPGGWYDERKDDPDDKPWRRR